MKKIRNGIAILAMVLGLGACAPGIFNGLGKDGMSMLVFYRTDHKPLTEAQYRAVADIAKEMHITLDYQLSSPYEAGASGLGAYGAAGYLGGLTQGHFYPGAIEHAAAGWTGTVYGLGGLVNGLVTYSYSEVFDLGQMVETTMRDREKYDNATVFNRVHVVAAFVRTRNTSDKPAPMPDWHGDQVGN
ncbi:MAG: hypothetical protein ACYC6X_00025 [Minisyncoccota bacterium]